MNVPARQVAEVPAPLTSPADAERVAGHLVDVIDTLGRVLTEETELLRAGRLSAATALGPAKTELSRFFVADMMQLRASRKMLAQVSPAGLATLRARHDSFQALLQSNLTVVATAHAVSESIVRGVSIELARKAAPQTYGASGYHVAPSRSAAQPLSVSRSL